MKYMNTARILTALALAGGLAACTNGNGAVEPPVTSVNVGSPSYSHLQLAVGTANIAGQLGLNTVVTLRQPDGLSAVGYSAPSLTWDGAFTNTGGASAGVDAGLKQITGILPSSSGGSATASTFGSGGNSWGAFGYGFSPANSSAGGGSGSIQYGCLPFFASSLVGNIAGGSPTCSGGGVQFAGGPPAYPQVRSAALLGQIGAFLGFTPFAGIVPAANPATPGTTTFTLGISIPTVPVTTLTPVTAKMTSFAGLPAMVTPTFAPDGTGGGTISYTIPAGVTEALVILYNWGPSGTGGGNCNYDSLSGTPFVYSVEIPNPSGAATVGTVALSDNLGPSPASGTGSLPTGDSTHTFCTAADNAASPNAGASADTYQVIGIGFDYPAFEAAYPQSNGNATPVITGANGQADLTMSDLSPVTPY
jgi:hypothetical protein